VTSLGPVTCKNIVFRGTRHSYVASAWPACRVIYLPGANRWAVH
jgi:hypothetical protein